MDVITRPLRPIDATEGCSLQRHLTTANLLLRTLTEKYSGLVDQDWALALKSVETNNFIVYPFLHTVYSRSKTPLHTEAMLHTLEVQRCLPTTGRYTIAKIKALYEHQLSPQNLGREPSGNEQALLKLLDQRQNEATLRPDELNLLCSVGKLTTEPGGVRMLCSLTGNFVPERAEFLVAFDGAKDKTLNNFFALAFLCEFLGGLQASVDDESMIRITPDCTSFVDEHEIARFWMNGIAANSRIVQEWFKTVDYQPKLTTV